MRTIALSGLVSAGLLALFGTALLLPVQAGPDAREAASLQIWEEQLKPAHFNDREIVEDIGHQVIEIKAPPRAEDATVVPLSIHSRIPQSEEHYIRRIHIFIDKNPLPLVGIFELTPQSGRADLAMRVRVDDFSYIRAIAETSDGKLYMDSTYIRSMGGCSAPPGASLQESIAKLGEMRLNTIGELEFGKPSLAQLQIRHPNITGLAIDQKTRARPPAYFVKAVEIDYAGEPVLKAQLTFAISQDPSFRFFFLPSETGEMTVRIVDTKELEFTHSVTL